VFIMLQSLNKPFADIRAAFMVAAVLSVAACSSSQERARSYYDNGMKLLAAHDNARAAVEFKNALRLNKSLLPAWRSLAQVDELIGQRGELIPVFRSIVELDPTDYAARLKLAKLLLASGSLDEALNLANAAKEADDQNADVRALRALVLFKLNDMAGSAEEAQAARKIDPGNAGAAIVLAAERLEQGDSKGALQFLDSEAVSRTHDIGIDLFKLKIFAQIQDLPQVESLLRKLVELYPQEPEFRERLVQLYMFQRRPDDAEREERAMVAAAPANSEAALELVRFLYAIKGAAAAQKELDSRIGAGGEVFPYRIAAADLEFAQNRFAEGTQLLEQLITTEKSPDHVLTAQIKLAEIYLNRKQIEAADALVTEILRKDSRNNSGLRLRAGLHMERGELEASINDLRQALNDQPRSTELMLLLATAYERSGSIELAEKQFADAMKTSNFEPTVGLNYVAFLQRRGNAARAEDVLTELGSRWPQNTQILSALAQVRLARQNWVGAQEVAETLRRINKTQGIADEIMGAALAGRNKLDESIGVLRSAYDAEPLAGRPMYALVRAYIAAKQTDRALGFLQTVLKANPANAEAQVLLGAVQLANNNPSQALKSFQTAIEAQPKDPAGYTALANLYVSQSKEQEAQDVIQKGIEAQPDNGILQLMLAGLLEQKGDYEAAISKYEYLLKKDPGSLVVLNNLASLLADRRSDQASLNRARSLAAALRQSPVPQFKDTLGWVMYLQGDYKAAVPLLEDAARSISNRAMVHYHLGMTYMAAGEADKASDQLRLALNQSPDGELKSKIEAALKKSAS
jgi:tetratricopeptide (TPR) repeat protein